jgi:hypothetical protein
MTSRLLRLTSLSRSSIYAAMKSGALPYRNVGRKTLILAEIFAVGCRRSRLESRGGNKNDEIAKRHKMRQYKFHDIANLFPMMDRKSKEFADKVEASAGADCLTDYAR